jgi:hypothetical protein
VLVPPRLNLLHVDTRRRATHRRLLKHTELCDDELVRLLEFVVRNLEVLEAMFETPASELGVRDTQGSTYDNGHHASRDRPTCSTDDWGAAICGI